jgi:hypothetical protein
MCDNKYTISGLTNSGDKNGDREKHAPDERLDGIVHLNQ